MPAIKPKPTTKPPLSQGEFDREIWKFRDRPQFKKKSFVYLMICLPALR